MTVATGAKSRVFRLASRVVLHGDARPMLDGVAQTNVGGLAHEHEAALAGSLGDGSDARQTAKCLVVSPLQGLEGLGDQRGEDNSSDPGKDRRIVTSRGSGPCPSASSCAPARLSVRRPRFASTANVCGFPTSSRLAT